MKLSALFSKIRTFMGGFILSSLIVGFLCISFVHNMSAHAGMDMSHVVHTNASTITGICCDAGANNHMELWKSTLVGILETIQSLFVLVVFAFVAKVAFAELFGVPRPFINFFSLRYRQYTREHPDIGLFNSLRLAFAKGILNPKLF